MLIINVTQLNTYVKSVLDGDKNLNDVYIKAEISNFRTHYKSGHMYFKLKDDKSTINAVMFSWQAKHLKFEPEDGLEIIAKASVSLYEGEGAYQACVVDMQPVGIGKSIDDLAKLTEKLEKKGYFLQEHKKNLPIFPKIIGVITSKTGAVIEDIKKVIERRYPVASIIFCPTLVQGLGAKNSLVSALKTLDNCCDVIIVGRGGGSTEDISPFNSEAVADSIFNSNTPIISAVGHETDVTICDMVADIRAGTPSIAAELATPNKNNLITEIYNNKVKGKKLVLNILKREQKHLEYINMASTLRNPMKIVENKEEKLDFIQKTMYNLKEQTLHNKFNSLAKRGAVLNSLNPMAVLSRGYGAIFKDNKPIDSVAKLALKDKIKVKLTDGSFLATIDDISLEVKDE